MATVTKSIRVPEEQVEYIENNYKSFNQGVVDAISALQYSRLYSLNELKGKFTPEEWAFFAESLNGTIVDNMFRCSSDVLIVHSRDSESLSATAERNNVDIDSLSEKIKTLTGAQVEALYFRIEQFWNKPNNLEEWAEF